MKSELEKLVGLQKTDTNIRRLKKAIESADERRAGIEQEFERHAFEIRGIQNKSEEFVKRVQVKVDVKISGEWTK